MILLEKAEHHAVFSKSAGTLSVAARGFSDATAVDMAADILKGAALPVHRLDRQTSGCLLMARSPFGERALVEAFRKRLVDKRYLAIVDGCPNFKKTQVDKKLRRVERQKKHASKLYGGAEAWQVIDDEGLSASTHFKVVYKNEERAIVMARPHSGRLHQIRVHAAHLGHTVIGDKIYGGSYNERLRLHAWCLSFPSPKGKRVFTHAPIDDAFLYPLFDQSEHKSIKRMMTMAFESFLASEKKSQDNQPTPKRRVSEKPKKKRRRR